MSILENSRQTYAIVRHATIGLFAVSLFWVACFCNNSFIDWRSCTYYVLLGIVCEILVVRIKNSGAVSGESTLSFVMVWGAAVLWGPLAAMYVASVGMLAGCSIAWLSCIAYFRLSTRINRQKAEPSLPQMLTLGVLYNLAQTWLDRRDYPSSWLVQLILYNTCHIGFLTAVSSLTYLGFGGTQLGDPYGAITILNLVLPFVIGMGVYLVLDSTFFTVVCVIWEPGNAYKKSIKDFVLRCRILWRQNCRANIPSYVILGPVALILAYLQVNVGCISLLAVILPFYAMRYAYTLTMDQVTMYRDTITTLGTYMQHYHPYTRGHLRRVADLSERLARELKLPADVIMLMSDAGMLHDIGKVGVSEEILDKVARLTDEEWEEIKSHPVKGAEIVSHLEFLDRIVGWVKYHHKWYNGSGYPDDGVKDLPIEAAIIAVADAFDAMTDDRELSLGWSCDACGYEPEDGSRPEVCPMCGAEKRRRYRQPLSLDRAIDELRRGAGSQFHPEVVKAFLKLTLIDETERRFPESGQLAA